MGNEESSQNSLPKLPTLTPTLKDYTKYEKFLGKGAYGMVYLIRHKDGPLYAAKEINLMGLTPEEIAAAEREAGLMKALDHKNIIGFKHVQKIDDKLYIIME